MRIEIKSGLKTLVTNRALLEYLILITKTNQT